MSLPRYKKYTVGAAMEGRKTDFPLYLSRQEERNQSEQERYYPDEWLIANTLRKYIRLRQPGSGKKIVVLAEGWAGNGIPARGNSIVARPHLNNDEGGENTPAFNKEILQAIENALLANNDTLILIPYLYYWHHPGLAIQVKNNRLIYLDPLGAAPRKSEVFALQARLKLEMQFQTQYVTTAQQLDGNICGFVLTASMMKFIEEFLTKGNITTMGFESPKPNINTAYMFQMYINNWIFDDIKSSNALTHEIMIASRDLWAAFIDEQKVTNAEALKIILYGWDQAQDAFMEDVFHSRKEEAALNVKKLQLLNNVQSKIIELIFIQQADLVLNIQKLIKFSMHLLHTESINDFEKYDAEIKENFKLDNLLSNHRIENTRNTLKLGVPNDKSLTKSLVRDNVESYAASNSSSATSAQVVGFFGNRVRPSAEEMIKQRARATGTKWIKEPAQDVAVLSENIRKYSAPRI